MSDEAHSLIAEIGRRATLCTADPRETTFLYQRISVAIQRFNAVCLANTLTVSDRGGSTRRARRQSPLDGLWLNRDASLDDKTHFRSAWPWRRRADRKWVLSSSFLQSAVTYSLLIWILDSHAVISFHLLTVNRWTQWTVCSCSRDCSTCLLWACCMRNAVFRVFSSEIEISFSNETKRHQNSPVSACHSVA